MPAAADIQRMFGSIAGRYDALNRILSLGIDRAWRRRTRALLGPSPGEVAADLCCGTGDLALTLAESGATVVGADFSREMLSLAGRKGLARLAEADCLSLPFKDASFDLVTVAFGVRNLADLRGGLNEMLRILRPGGRLGILEFASPRGRLFRPVYLAYLRYAVPLIGAAVSGRRAAYRYLSTSIRSFPDQALMKAILREEGFEQVRHIDFALGIAALYIARRPEAAPAAATGP
ncbi:MAG TPA: bifunctional demethylmenaquinone methyltransferase/2-methoxy-6-polyprenyl-1,4-benzoquinol methylase UbiE [Candidatus Polarisedimenticolia bacterium]|nr:bifunctional demethylmenaquinone methyltransferase/2-methoxy-6-polyprenyl-1,4-benzoquinol methylase UbiE [Candidatus Polarisedimenticolia bacterium]